MHLVFYPTKTLSTSENQINIQLSDVSVELWSGTVDKGIMLTLYNLTPEHLVALQKTIQYMIDYQEVV